MASSSFHWLREQWAESLVPFSGGVYRSKMPASVSRGVVLSPSNINCSEEVAITNGVWLPSWITCGSLLCPCCPPVEMGFCYRSKDVRTRADVGGRTVGIREADTEQKASHAARGHDPSLTVCIMNVGLHSARGAAVQRFQSYSLYSGAEGKKFETARTTGPVY